MILNMRADHGHTVRVRGHRCHHGPPKALCTGVVHATRWALHVVRFGPYPPTLSGLAVTVPPARPVIYHITHVANLQSIAKRGALLSDRMMIAQGGSGAPIGMQGIKQRRLNLPVPCHPGDFVGDFVPFYFCPRSIMLFVIHCGNHPDLTYRGGQGPIVHLVADLHAAVQWANRQGRRWAFSLSNAGAAYAEFRADLTDLGEIDWTAVASNDFRSSSVKESKQAEFLVHTDFPWSLVERIGVASPPIAVQVRTAVQRVAHQPNVSVEKAWYF
jgi:hypothetical protein